MMVRFYLPDEAENFSYLLEYCTTAFEDAYGGCTITTGSGAWLNPNTGERVREAVHIFDVFVPAPEPNAYAWFDRLADYVRREGKQHSVFYVPFYSVGSRTIGPETIIEPPIGGPA